MTTECSQFVFGFHPQKRREIRAQFDGGAITSDGGGLLLREVEKRVGILRQFSACFTDYRNPDRIEHTVEELVAQRVYGLALGYEDLNDHEELRNDCPPEKLRGRLILGRPFSVVARPRLRVSPRVLRHKVCLEWTSRPPEDAALLLLASVLECWSR